MEPQEKLDEVQKKINDFAKPLQPAIDQLKELMKPIESKTVDGVEVHRMIGNVVMIKARTEQEQKEIFDNLR